MGKPQIQFNNTILGNARLATPQELYQAGLLNNNGGFVFGRYGGRLLEKPAEVQGHCLIVGGTGTGKSRGVAIPSLLRWNGSILAIDVKGELSEITARHRTTGKTYIFNPESNGDPYDPLRECKTVDGANELARSLIPEPQSGEPFWAKTAQAFLAAGALDGAMGNQRFSDVIERLCITPPEQLIEEFQNSPYKAVRMLSSVGVGMPEKTMGGVFAELRSKILTLGADPNIERATSRSGWTPQSLEEGASIYLRVSERMLRQYEGLWSVIISQVLRYLSSRPERAMPPILILLDEFARLGKLPGILEALATLRSRNVHIAIFIQSMAQLDFIYSPEERKIIADNCGFKLVLSATDPETQRYFSDLSGQATVWVGNQGTGRGESSAGSIIGSSSYNDSKGLSQQGTPLIRPEEFSKLISPVLFAQNLYPSFVYKSFWDKDPTIAPMVGIKVEVPKVKKSKLGWKSIKILRNMIIGCAALLLGFFLAILATQLMLKYNISHGVLQEQISTGTLTLEEAEITKTWATDYNSMLQGISQNLFTRPGSLGAFYPVWLLCTTPSLAFCIILSTIFGKLKKA